MQPLAPAADEAPPKIAFRWPSAIDARLAGEVIALYNDSIRTENILGYVEALAPEQGRKVLERMDEAVRRREKYFFEIQCGERLIGMALLTPNGLPNCRHIVEWSKGIIHSDYRGRSVLKQAVRTLAERCLEMGWDLITLDVRADTRAHRLWSALGFQEYGRLQDYARIDGVSQPGAFLYAATRDLLRAMRAQ